MLEDPETRSAAVRLVSSMNVPVPPASDCQLTAIPWLVNPVNGIGDPNVKMKVKAVAPAVMMGPVEKLLTPRGLEKTGDDAELKLSQNSTLIRVAAKFTAVAATRTSDIL